MYMYICTCLADLHPLCICEGQCKYNVFHVYVYIHPRIELDVHVYMYVYVYVHV